MKRKFKYIYGPVPSWRLGSSLGIDLLSQEEKVCNFDCVYCQLGANKKHAVERSVYVPVKEVVEELDALPDIKIDYITFSGRGECTLSENLGESIKAVKLIRREPVAVITNASLMGLEEVKKELFLADFVVAKLDACNSESLAAINRPDRRLKFEGILEGIKGFKKGYKGKLALQMMFIDSNKGDVDKLIELANYIKPDEIQINTPLRPSAVKPLAKEEIFKIKESFISACKSIGIITVYDKEAPEAVYSISDADTLNRRGKV